MPTSHRPPLQNSTVVRSTVVYPPAAPHSAFFVSLWVGGCRCVAFFWPVLPPSRSVLLCSLPRFPACSCQLSCSLFYGVQQIRGDTTDAWGYNRHMGIQHVHGDTTDTWGYNIYIFITFTRRMRTWHLHEAVAETVYMLTQIHTLANTPLMGGRGGR